MGIGVIPIPIMVDSHSHVFCLVPFPWNYNETSISTGIPNPTHISTRNPRTLRMCRRNLARQCVMKHFNTSSADVAALGRCISTIVWILHREFDSTRTMQTSSVTADKQRKLFIVGRQRNIIGIVQRTKSNNFDVLINSLLNKMRLTVMLLYWNFAYNKRPSVKLAYCLQTSEIFYAE